MQKYKNTKIQKYKNAKIQKYKNAKKEYKNTTKYKSPGKLLNFTGNRLLDLWPNASAARSSFPQQK